LPVDRNGLVLLVTIWVFFGSAARLNSADGVAPLSAPSPMAVPWLMVAWAAATPMSTVVFSTCTATAPLLELLPEELLDDEELELLPEELLEDEELELPLEEPLEEELPEEEELLLDEEELPALL
jgi:hypothetical protein